MIIVEFECDECGHDHCRFEEIHTATCSKCGHEESISDAKVK